MDPLTDARWEPFVAAHPSALAYHHPAWLRVLDREYARPGVHLACEDSSGELRGVLSLIQTRGMPLRRGHRSHRRLSSLPRTPLGGPLALDHPAAEALVRAAMERADALQGVLLELKLPSGVSDLGVDGTTCLPWRETYFLDLPERPEEIRFGNARNNARIAWAVRHAEKLGVRLRVAETLDELKAWYPLYLATMRTHVVPPRPFRLFAAMWEEFAPRGLMRLLLAERPGPRGLHLVSGSIFLMFGRTVLYALNGRSLDEQTMRSNELILSSAIRSACAEGYRRFDFGEVPGGKKGLAAFKTKWGSSPEMLYRLYYPPSQDFESGEVEGGGSAARLGRAAWRRVPLGVTARVGERAYAFM